MENLWIDACEFDDYGGFILETQFVREMGQSYLMADGIGEPISPATTIFNVKEGGFYRVFLRTKNWCVEYAPDGLIVEIDGQKSKHVCSEMNVRDWYFEIGGDFLLSAGEHSLKIYDKTGWFGRFAAVVITNNYDFTPSKELKMLKAQRLEFKGIEKNVIHNAYYDLIVVGGGVGGIITAITAARYGLKTALINDRPRLGGNAAEEANVALEGAAIRGYQETGVILEIKNYREMNSISWSDAFEKYVSDEKNIDVFSNMLLTDAETENSTITKIFTIDTITLQEYEFISKQYVDATGDGWLGYYAGALYRIGREAKFQYNEEFAPDEADGNTMSGCTTRKPTSINKTACSYMAVEGEKEEHFTRPNWAFVLPQGDDLGREPRYFDRGDWWLEMPNDYDDLFENEFVRDSMIRMSAGYFDWMKNSWEDREKVSKYKLCALSTYNAKRETRRLIGDYIMTEHDFVEGQSYPDSVCYCGWKLDVHHVDGIFSGKKGRFTLNKSIPITPIPFGSLYSKNISNLMMVGRCISVTHIALGTVRVMLTAAVMGQAVATATWLCNKYDVTPRGIRENHIDELQQLLLKDGAHIPGVFNHDEDDLARGAKITADSYVEGGEPCNVVNGRTKKSDGEPYAWISCIGLPQSITLTFDNPKTIKQVRVTCDMPLDKYSYGYLPQPQAIDLITDFSVSVCIDNKWVDMARVSDNIQRLVVVDIEPSTVTAVKITVIKTNSSEKAVIPEIRIY